VALLFLHPAPDCWGRGCLFITKSLQNNLAKGHITILSCHHRLMYLFAGCIRTTWVSPPNGISIASAILWTARLCVQHRQTHRPCYVWHL